jgi:2-dehydro-3-deoxyphosphogluconate aldolase/(4S)-4-hydroxy-2-oxoglutarate aldolase
MRTKEQIITQLTQPGVIAVVRVSQRSQVIPVCEALAAGGVHALEITLTVPDAIGAIREASTHFGGKALLGVGSVLSAAQAEAAIDAGAEFVVSPIGKAEIATVARAAAKPVVLGAYTPTEAQTAYEAGADFIKLFPAEELGPNYIKALRAPMPHLQIIPTGGVTLRNIGDFFKAGCPAVGVGSSLLSRELIDRGNWRELACRAGEFVTAALAARK